MLLRGGLRAVEAGAVATLEHEGEGVEVAEEEDAVVIFAGTAEVDRAGELVDCMVAKAKYDQGRLIGWLVG